jgi:hypothetical protein
MDLSGLDKWPGERVILFKRGFYPDDPSHFHDTIMVTLDREMADFNPHTDYIVPIGDNLVVATVAIWLDATGHTPCKFLKYDRMHGGYYPITLGDFTNVD